MDAAVKNKHNTKAGKMCLLTICEIFVPLRLYKEQKQKEKYWVKFECEHRKALLEEKREKITGEQQSEIAWQIYWPHRHAGDGVSKPHLW